MKIKTNIISRKLFLAIFAVVAISVFGFSHINKANADPALIQWAAKTDSQPDLCTNVSFTHPMTWINCFLLYILAFIGVLMSIAATIFGWIMKPDNMSAVMNNGAIYTTWAMVRDTLNIAFILVLLFSAFATVFQVDKYSYKKILLKLVIVALLVNFSFPITRFIIDFSNILMYQILNNLGGGSGSFAHLANQGGLAQILHPPKSASTSTWVILTDIVFTFIIAVTFFIIAIMFVIRTVALAILIIFSPVAFTGSIIPPTAQKASSWWDALFKYAFFGPIMVFMIYVAIQMMSSINSVGLPSAVSIANSQSIHPNFIASLALLAIPIVILWIGIGFAQSLSIAGAGAVTKSGKDFTKWVPNAMFRSTGIPGGIKKATDYYGAKGAPGFLGKIPGLRGSEKTEATEAKIASWLGVKGSVEQSIKNESQKMKEANESLENLSKQVLEKNSIPAAYRLALDGKIKGEEYVHIMDKIKDPKIREMLEGETRKKKINVVIDYKIKQERDKGPTTHNQEVAVAEKELGKLKPKDWENQNMEDFMHNNPYRTARMDAAHHVYNNYSDNNKNNVIQNMTGNNYKAGKGYIWQ